MEGGIHRDECRGSRGAPRTSSYAGSRRHARHASRRRLAREPHRQARLGALQRHALGNDRGCCRVAGSRRREERMVKNISNVRTLATISIRLLLSLPLGAALQEKAGQKQAAAPAPQAAKPGAAEMERLKFYLGEWD